MAAGRAGTGPSAFGRRTTKQVIFNLDKVKADELYSMLTNEGMSVKEFLTLCVDGYLTSDHRIRGIIEFHRKNKEITLSEANNGDVFSDKELSSILKEIESGDTQDDGE